MFGVEVLDESLSLFSDFLSFDDENWRLWYNMPGSQDVQDAKNRVVDAFERYIAIPREKRPDMAPVIDHYERVKRAKGIPDREIATVIAMLYFVTNTNTFKLAFWIMAHLLNNPEYLEQIKSEIKPAFDPVAQKVDFQYLLDKCPIFNAAFDETLRLCSTTASIRTTTKAVEVHGKIIPADSQIMCPLRELHWNTDVWGQDPSVWDPSRFIKTRNLNRNSSHRPFGGDLVTAQDVCLPEPKPSCSSRLSWNVLTSRSTMGRSFHDMMRSDLDAEYVDSSSDRIERREFQLYCRRTEPLLLPLGLNTRRQTISAKGCLRTQGDRLGRSNSRMSCMLPIPPTEGGRYVGVMSANVIGGHDHWKSSVPSSKSSQTFRMAGDDCARLSAGIRSSHSTSEAGVHGLAGLSNASDVARVVLDASSMTQPESSSKWVTSLMSLSHIGNRWSHPSPLPKMVVNARPSCTGILPVQDLRTFDMGNTCYQAKSGAKVRTSFSWVMLSTLVEAGQWLGRIVLQWLELDDVFKSDFLDSILLVQTDEHQESSKIVHISALTREGWGISHITTVSKSSLAVNLTPGPYVCWKGELCRPYRLYDDPNLAFVDVLDIAGIRTTAGCHAFFDLSRSSVMTAPAVQTLVDQSAVSLGTVKLGSLVTREEPTESVDYHAAFNPRGDGCQSAWSSSGRSGTAIAAYDWLDFTIASDSEPY
nr:cytochrome p450 3a40 [Quercus suber]